MNTLKRWRQSAKCLLAFVCILLLSFTLVQIPVRAEQKLERKKVKVAYVISERYQEGKEGERKSGFGYDYLQEIRYYTGWEYEYVYGSFSELLQKLCDGEIDLMGNLSYTAERDKYINFGSEEQGKESFYMYVRNDNDEINSENYTSLMDKKLGVAKNSYQEELLKKWVEERNLNCEIIEYINEADRNKDLNEGVIDGAVGTTMLAEDLDRYQWHSAYKIGSESFYFGVSGQRLDLLHELNYAQQEILDVNPFYNEEIQNKYLAGRTVANVYMSNEKTEYLKENNSFVVGYLQDYAPLCFKDEETGKMSGALKNLLDDISKTQKFQYKTLAYKTYDTMMDALQRGEIDMAFPVLDNAWMTESKNIIVSDTVCETTMTALYEGEFSERIYDRIATPETSIADAFYVDSLEKGSKCVHTKDFNEGVEVVKSGKAGCIFILTDSYLMYEKGFFDIDTMNSVKLPERIGITFAFQPENAMLLSIINQGLTRISKAEIQNIITENSHIVMEYTFKDFFQDNSIVFMLVLFVIILIVVIGAFIIQRKLRNATVLAEQSRDQAIQANKAKTDFLFCMSHDIRTPINGIMGMLEIAERNIEDTDKVRDCHEKIRLSSGYLLSLVNDVLDMSRLESGNVEYKTEAVDVEKLLEECYQIVKPIAMEHKITLEQHIEEWTDGTHISGSPLHLRQIYINLVNNAIKYNKEGGKVDVYVRQVNKTDDEVIYRLIIKDTGVGMSKEFLKHAFEPFSQENGKIRSQYQGTGLGLSIVKRMVDQMGGTIHVESEKNKGSNFYIMLPLQLDKEYKEDKKQELMRKGTPSIDGLKILLVEDNSINMEIAKYTLMEAGAEVIGASNGKIAVEIFEKSPEYEISAVLMDVMMPVMDGLEATKVIRALERKDAQTVPIIGMSANAFSEDINAGKNAGMNEYLTKPIEYAKVVEVIYNSLLEASDESRGKDKK
ncbi:MAG: transporter substrate-binding domain-containing protein [Lachnospiraceae bacterium]|nr:transporter substrate-binding domain-containing protein [Lachnospiraceae bacterium]